MKHSALSPPRCQPGDLFTVAPDAPESLVQAVATYLAPFAAPQRGEDGKDVLCVGCGKPVDGLMNAISPGSHVAFQWGIVHGEAFCSGCGYPARGMHYVKDTDGEEILTLNNFFLCYHPDELTWEDSESSD